MQAVTGKYLYVTDLPNESLHIFFICVDKHSSATSSIIYSSDFLC